MKAKKPILAKMEKQGNGYLFPELGIHVIASRRAEAKERVKELMGIDVDEKVREIVERAERHKQKASDILKQKEKDNAKD